MSERHYVGAIDQGTVATEFVIFDRRGRVVAEAHERHDRYHPQHGWVEHDPIEIWENTKRVVNRALDAAAIAPTQLAAIGVSNQRETTLLWDGPSGSPVYNAIGWQDRRTVDRIEGLQETDLAETIRAKTGLEPDAYFPASKAEWLLEHADPVKLDRMRPQDVRERTKTGEVLIGTVDSWLVYNLTGNHVTDVTNASRAMLYDIHSGTWDETLLTAFDVPRAALPEVRPSSDETPYGYTDADGFLGAEVPVTAAIGDQQAALFGQACFEPGEVKNTCGMGSFCLMHTGTEAVASEQGLLTTVAFQRSGEPIQYALEGAVFVTGDAIAWLQDVGFLTDAVKAGRLAQSVHSTNEVYLVPAFAGLGTPYWDQRARGTIVGLTRGTRKEHLARAAIEAMVFQTRDTIEAMDAATRFDREALKIDGGAMHNDFICELLATVTDSNLARPKVDETTALGAAYAAGLAVGYWADLKQLRANWRVDRKFAPTADRADVDRRYRRWHEAVERARDWARDD